MPPLVSSDHPFSSFHIEPCPGGALIPGPLVDRMRAILPCQSKEVVMEVLGISSNTWTKVKRREPIRASIAERLIRRFEFIQTQH